MEQKSMVPPSVRFWSFIYDVTFGGEEVIRRYSINYWPQPPSPLDRFTKGEALSLLSFLLEYAKVLAGTERARL